MSKIKRKFSRRIANIPERLKVYFTYNGEDFVCVREKYIYRVGLSSTAAFVSKDKTSGYWKVQMHGFWHTAKSLPRVMQIVDHCKKNQAAIPAHMWNPGEVETELDMAMF